MRIHFLEDESSALGCLVQEKRKMANGLEMLVKSNETSLLAVSEKHEREMGVLAAELDRARQLLAAGKRELAKSTRDKTELAAALEHSKEESKCLKARLVDAEQGAEDFRLKLERVAKERHDLAIELEDLGGRLDILQNDRHCAEDRAEKLDFDNIRLRGELARLEREAHACLGLQDKSRMLEDRCRAISAELEREKAALNEALDLQRKENLLLLERLQESSFESRSLHQRNCSLEE